MVAPPLFVIGHIRSGTTVLADLLRAFCPRAVPLEERDFEGRDFWQDLGLKIGSPRTGTCCLGAEDRDVTPAQKQTARAHVDGRTSAGRHIISKNPHLSNKIGFVHRLFPEARFVHIVRQDLSVIASTKQRFLDSSRGSNVWGFPFLYYWPEDTHLPCWWVIPAKRGCPYEEAARQKAYREARGIAPPPVPKHDDPDDFRLMHQDRTRYYPGKGFRRIPESWLRINSIILQQLAELSLPKLCLHINYRDLVQHTHEVLREITRFAEIDTIDPSQVPPSLDPAPQEKWKETLTVEERGTCAMVREELSTEARLLAGSLPGPLFAE